MLSSSLARLERLTERAEYTEDACLLATGVDAQAADLLLLTAFKKTNADSDLWRGSSLSSLNQLRLYRLASGAARL